jgi:hypothetical protein
MALLVLVTACGFASLWLILQLTIKDIKDLLFEAYHQLSVMNEHIELANELKAEVYRLSRRVHALETKMEALSERGEITPS